MPPPSARRSVRFVFLIAALPALALPLLASACRQRGRGRARSDAGTSASIRVMAGMLNSRPRVRDAGPEGRAVDGGLAGSVSEKLRRADAGAPSLRLDKPIDLGPAKALAAISSGVLLRTKLDELLFRPYDAAKFDAASAPVDEESLSVLPAPAISGSSRAYWVSKGRLVRRAIHEEGGGVTSLGDLEEIASDAYDATRAAVLTVGSMAPRDLVSYVARPARPRGDRRARIWIEPLAGQERSESGPYDLSEDASGASSVAIIGEGERVWAIALDARVAMCPLHARSIEYADSASPELGPDVVIFVGEPQPAHTEVGAALWAGEPTAFVPLPRYGGGFGLALVSFGRDPKLDSPASWFIYPATTDRALTTVVNVCNEPWLAYVRPADASQDSMRVAVMAPMIVQDGAPGLGSEVVVAEARRFLSLSFAPVLPSGGRATLNVGKGTSPAKWPVAGWIAWSANGNGWARAIRCQ